MTGKGITLKRLRATGSRVEPAEVVFVAGLNVIGYISQTGKSYIVQCIDFMLGGKTLPRSIRQSKGYDTLWLEFTDTGGASYVLKRPLSGGPYRLYTMPLANITETSPSKRLSSTKKAKTSASSFVMGLSGLPNAKLKANAENQKATLSFRTIAHFFIVGEISMIDEPSPIQSRHGYAQTTERSAFRFLLTGKDDSDLEEVGTGSPEDVADRVRREVYDELIRQLDAEIQQLRGAGGEGGTSLQGIEQRLAVSAAEVADISDRIRQQTMDRRDAWLELQTAESRLLVLNALLARFSLLRSHYESDLKRLDFISEGEHYLNQLETITCPLCGASLAEHSREPCDGNDGALTLVKVREAFDREAVKIRTHVGDLESTVGVLQTEQNEVTDKATALGGRVREIDHRLRNELAPMMSAAKSQVEELAKARSRLLYLESLDSRLAALRAARNELGEPSEAEADDAEGDESTSVEIDDQAITDFCSMMRGLLERWHFLPADRDVTFDTAKFDFIVDGQARRNNGKGVRAIIHAAFSVTLLHYCLAKDLPHPRFVILDSPLTTFKEPRQNVRPEDIDEVPGEVQTAFFEDLANTDSNAQIIVIENKQPPASVKDRIQYTEFVGPIAPGRPGFFPTVKNS